MSDPTDRDSLAMGPTLAASPVATGHPALDAATGPTLAASTLTDDGGSLETGATHDADPATDRSHAREGSLNTVDPSHYVIGDDVARGGMGVVRQARDARTGRLVAIKELLGDPRPEQLRRFEREARITAQLQHPSIVPVYEVGQWPDGRPFFAMKLVGGRPFDVVVDEASDPEARLALVPRILPAVEAIAYAHEKGVIHRDLKPANVLLGEFGETIVIDWGIAKGIGEPDEPTLDTDSLDAANEGNVLTRVGAVMGTPAYMPPEQARAETLDARADVYSLGALLYHSLCGQAPYQGEVFHQLLEGPPVSLSERAPSAPPDLVSIIQKAMAYDRKQRYRDARELAVDLEAFQTGRLVGAYEYTSWELLTRFVRRNRALTLALASLVVLSAVAVAFIVREQQAAEHARQQAVAAELRARGQEREAHERLAQVHWQNSIRRLQRGDHLGAELFAAAAMVESPAPPRGSSDGETDAASARLAGPATTWAAARALRFAKQTRTLVEHEDWVYDVLVSDDDRWLVTTSADRRAVIWDVNTGRVHRVLAGHEGTVSQAALDSESRQLATSGYDGTIRLWSFPQGELVRTIEYPADRVYGVCFAADGTLLGAGSDGRVAVFDADTGTLRRSIEATTAIPWRLSCPRDEPHRGVEFFELPRRRDRSALSQRRSTDRGWRRSSGWHPRADARRASDTPRGDLGRRRRRPTSLRPLDRRTDCADTIRERVRFYCRVARWTLARARRRRDHDRGCGEHATGGAPGRA